MSESKTAKESTIDMLDTMLALKPSEANNIKGRELPSTKRCTLLIRKTTYASIKTKIIKIAFSQ